MIDAWIVVREEKHVDDKYWICLDKEDALTIAKEVSDYWLEHYDEMFEANGKDMTCYEGQVFHCSVEECFDVSVIPATIRNKGETEHVD